VLSNVDRRLAGREWIACKDFTVADILLATVLREVRQTELLASYPEVAAYYARALGRPAWQRALAMHAETLGVPVEEIQ
jgi:glutathione S-transferase